MACAQGVSRAPESSIFNLQSSIAIGLAFLLSLSACSTTPEPTDWRPVVSAFKDCLDTYYAARIKGPEAEKALARRRAESGGRLIYELEKRGARPTRDEAQIGLLGLVPYVERYLHNRTEDVAFVEVEPGDIAVPGAAIGEGVFPGSFLVVAGGTREARQVALAGRRAGVGVVRYREALVLPLDVIRAGAAADPPRLWVLGHAVYLDVARQSAQEAEDGLALATAARLFAGTPDAERRDAQALVALLGGDEGEAKVAARALRGIAASTRRAPPPRALRLSLDAIRAGLESKDDDAALLASLDRLTPGERAQIVRAALRPGNLLAPPAPPRAGS